MDGPRLLRVRLCELVPLVGVELRSWGWVVAPLPWYIWCGWGLRPHWFRSLAWNCTLRVRWLTPSPGIAGVSISPLVALVSVELHSWGWVVAPLLWYIWCGWGLRPHWFRSLAWNCTLRVRWLTPSPGIAVGVGAGYSMH